MEILIIVVLLAIAVETTYLTVRSFRHTSKKHLAPVFIDTSVLIDGRIIFVAESGFFTRPLYIPRSVVGELQFLADNGDAEKRTRARHGLDVISQLQAIDGIETVIFPDGVKAEEGVDNRLLKLAKQHQGAVCTIDYNLNKVAVVEGIQVLNVNELTKSLRMAYLPGEHMRIALTQKGNDQHQGVGHLEDGTMVVVEQGGKYIGKEVEVEFIRSLQTAAGKMMFAKLVQGAKPARTERATRGTKAASTVTKEPIVEEKKPQARTRVAEAKPAKPAVAAKSTPAAKSSTVRRPQGNSRRRKSPEDSLMALIDSNEAK